MRRKEPPSQTSGRGRSLISTRMNQQLQRKATGGSARSLLPRSYSSPSAQNESELQSPQSAHKGYVMRSFSSPDSKNMDYRRNSDSFFRPKAHGSRSELDSDLENFEQFEEYLIDIDADQDECLLGHYHSSPEREEAKKVITTMLPGSGLQRVCIRPVPSATSQTLHKAREVMKKIQKNDSRDTSRPNFRPLVLNMSARHMLQSETEHEQITRGMEELQTSPELEMESAELERELDNAEQHLDRGVAMATEESDADTKNSSKDDLTNQLCRAPTINCAEKC